MGRLETTPRAAGRKRNLRAAFELVRIARGRSVQSLVLHEIAAPWSREISPVIFSAFLINGLGARERRWHASRYMAVFFSANIQPIFP
jgi:hypothetical protein